MGNTVSSTMAGCLVPIAPYYGRRISLAEPLDEGLGHSFCYIRPSPGSLLDTFPSSLDPSSNSFPTDSIHLGTKEVIKTQSETTFKAISGASVSANTSTPCTLSCHEPLSLFTKVPDDRAAAFVSTPFFTAVPLQPIPRDIISTTLSGPISGTFGPLSGPLERGFMSGPLERSNMSGPMELNFDRSHFSAPLPMSNCSHYPRKKKRKMVSQIARSVPKPMKKILSGAVPKKYSFKRSCENSFTLPVLKFDDGQNLQWAQGKAGEDRLHIVLSDTHGWLFVGIYDGFSGPDAPDFLMRNLYPAIYKELEALLCDQAEISDPNACKKKSVSFSKVFINKGSGKRSDCCSDCCFFSSTKGDVKSDQESAHSNKSVSQKCARPLVTTHFQSQEPTHESVPNFTQESSLGCNKDMTNSGRSSCLMRSCGYGENNQCTKSQEATHLDVLKALTRALEATEEAYLDMANQALKENPELALMGSCILVMLMKDEDVYVMNVGDSRAIVAQQRAKEDSPEVFQCSKVDRESQQQDSLPRLDLKQIVEGSPSEVDAFSQSCLNTSGNAPTLTAIQLSTDHSTSTDEEVLRIKSEHPDDDCSILNNRVKGTLKVTRAFGAGFLKKPHWNNTILEAFRINYVGTAPYISCVPSLCHHRLSPDDQFLILSSDGLYQYMSNQEAVEEVQCFMGKCPEGDPAQHLIEELLFRAAKKAGMDFHELLDIPQGDRRKYHDDISVMVILLDRMEVF